MDKGTADDDPCLSGKLLIQQRDRSRLLMCRSPEHEDDDVLWPLDAGVFVAFHKRVGGFTESTFEQEVERLREMGRMLCVDVLDALRIPSANVAPRVGAWLTLRPLSALFPREKILSFMNKSSCL